MDWMWEMTERKKINDDSQVRKLGDSRAVDGDRKVWINTSFRMGMERTLVLFSHVCTCYLLNIQVEVQLDT